MPAAPIDALERDALCDLFLELGPEAPTLCEGWDTLDLAAHLHIRENDVLHAGPAVFGGERFGRMTARVTDRAKARGLDALVADLRAGPPRVPWRVPGLRAPLNLVEWFVHHEDARRPNGGEPRPADPERDAALWGMVGRACRLMLLKGARGQHVELVAPGFGTVTGRGKGDPVRVEGPPGELLLYLYGRTGAAAVAVTGRPEAVAAFEASDFGI